MIVERTSEVNLAAHDMVVWDVTDRMNPELVGYLAPTMKAAYEMEPGKHAILLQLALTNNMMTVDAEADKTYFTKIGTNSFYTALFFPIKVGDKNDITRNNVSVASDHLVAWGKNRGRIENSLQSRIDKGRRKMESMSEEDKRLRNMVAEDGR